MKIPPRVHRAFTVLEMLACILVLSLLVVLLVGGMRGIRLRAQTAKCLLIHRQIAQGILAYAGDHSGQLPPYYDENRKTWGKHISLYLNEENKEAGYTSLRCPVAPREIATTIGVNYSQKKGKAPFGIKEAGYPGSMRLVEVSPGTVLTADIENPSGHSWFFSPNEFALTVDRDGDGVMETRPGTPPNNWFVFRHEKNNICSLADGSARVVTPRAWGLNENGLWGP